jgi:hypothetical protein
LGDVLLEDVVLDRPGQRARADPVLLSDQLVEQQQYSGRRVDGHRRRHRVQRDAVEEQPHVLQRVDRDPDLADLAVRDRVVGVVAHLGRQVKGHRQPGTACVDQPVIALVGFARGPEPGVLADGPGPPGVHRRVYAAGERIAAWGPEPLLRIEAGER